MAALAGSTVLHKGNSIGKIPHLTAVVLHPDVTRFPYLTSGLLRLWTLKRGLKTVQVLIEKKPVCKWTHAVKNYVF